MKTKVQFLVHEIDGKLHDKPVTWESDIFAYFPDMTASKGFKTAYSHIGQHSACSPDYAKESRQASKDEYKDLLTELISIGYDLEILNK